MIVALLSGTIVTVIAQSLFVGLMSAEDVREKLGVPSIGFVPLLSSTLLNFDHAKRPRPWDYVVEFPSSAFAESLRNIWISLTKGRSTSNGHVIALTSALPAEGKTTVALCLARILAMAGRKTIVVDCDLRLRGTTRLLTRKPQIGVVEVLQKSADLSAALIGDDRTPTKLLPVGDGDYSTADVFANSQLLVMLKELRSEFDVVILDLPPVLAVSDGLAIAPLADAVLLLTRWVQTPAKAAQEALRLLKSMEAPVAGGCLTFVDLRKQSKYSYANSAAYFRNYQNYYKTSPKQSLAANVPRFSKWLRTHSSKEISSGQ